MEVYRFLSTDCGIYLPHKDNCTIWYLRGLANGTRTRIKCTDVKVINVPMFEGLSVDDILNWVKNQPTKDRILRALPEEEKEIRKMPRAWISNVIYTLDDSFAEWVQQVQSERAAKILAEQQLGINLDPEIAEIFEKSKAISSK